MKGSQEKKKGPRSKEKSARLRAPTVLGTPCFFGISGIFSNLIYPRNHGDGTVELYTKISPHFIIDSSNLSAKSRQNVIWISRTNAEIHCNARKNAQAEHGSGRPAGHCARERDVDPAADDDDGSWRMLLHVADDDDEFDDIGPDTAKLMVTMSI